MVGMTRAELFAGREKKEAAKLRRPPLISLPLAAVFFAPGTAGWGILTALAFI
jgi:hypothetical protein